MRRLCMKSPNHRHQSHDVSHDHMLCQHTHIHTHTLCINRGLSFNTFDPNYRLTSNILGTPCMICTHRITQHLLFNLFEVLGFYLKVHIHQHKLMYTKLLHHRPTQVGKLIGICRHTLRYTIHNRERAATKANFLNVFLKIETSPC